MLKVEFPATALLVIKKTLPIAMFDVLENPWEVDMESFLEFDEEEREESSANLTDQME